MAGADVGTANDCRWVSECGHAMPLEVVEVSERMAHQGRDRQRRSRRAGARCEDNRAVTPQGNANHSRNAINLPPKRESHDTKVQAIDASSSPPERLAHPRDDPRSNDRTDATNCGRRMQHVPDQTRGIADADAAKEPEGFAPEAREPPSGAGRLTKAGKQHKEIMTGRVVDDGATPPGSSSPTNGIGAAAALGPSP